MEVKSLSDVKKANKGLLYECIREYKQVSITDLVHITKLSRPTVTELVRKMETEGTVAKVSRGASNGGRAPMLYGINSKAAFAMGIDLEFPTLRMAISDLEGEMICSSIRRYPPDSDKDMVLSLLLKQIEDMVSESKIDTEKLLGVGIGVPGVIDRKNNLSVIIERIQGWENVPIAAILEQRFGWPVYIYNDVDMLAWAERKFSDLKDADMLYIALLYGIGMSIWMDGKVIQGEGGNAGRIGHMLVNTEGPECKCGSRGCLGLYTGERAMCRIYRELSGKSVSGAKELLSLADQGDAAAVETLETTGHYLGIGIVNVANLFDISHIVVSAPFDVTRFIELAKPALAARERNTLRRKITVVPGKMGEEQYALGGCMMVLEKVSSEALGNLS